MWLVWEGVWRIIGLLKGMEPHERAHGKKLVAQQARHLESQYVFG